MNRLFILPSEDNAHQTSQNTFFLLTVKTKDHNVMIDGKKLLWSTSKKWYKNMWWHFKNCYWLRRWLHNRFFTKLCLFHKYFKVIAIDLSKQKALDSDPKVIEQTNFTRNIDQVENTTMFFIIEKAKETILNFTRNRERVILL